MSKSETKNSLAIVLNRSDYRESDSLLTIYTKDFGKLLLVARGLKKINSKLSGHLEIFNLVDVLIINGRGFDYIGSALNRKAFLNIKNSLNKIYFAGLALQHVNRLIKDNQKDERSFMLLQRFLEVLDNSSNDTFNKESGELLFIFFILKLLIELGYRPEIYECLSCRQPIRLGDNHFNLQNGGLICGACFAKEYAIFYEQGASFPELLTISDNCIKLMRFIMDNKLDMAKKLKLDKKHLKELSILINNFLNFQL